MQDDDTANPATFWVLDGEALWSQKVGARRQLACADCHGNADESMKGVAARYPAFNQARRRPVDLEQRINLCRAEHQKAAPLPLKADLLALTVSSETNRAACRSRTRAPTTAEAFHRRGRELFTRRQGQINLSCAQCHDDNWGKHLGGSLIPQAHPNGYPIYRLEWQGLGSLQRRLRNCMSGMRAQPFDYDALENVELEIFLMVRAKGMPLETPAVRP